MNFEYRRGVVFRTVSLHQDGGNFTADGFEHLIEIVEKSKNHLLIRMGTNLYNLNSTEVSGDQVSFTLGGTTYQATVKDEQQLLLEKMGFASEKQDLQGQLLAPMPGRILSLPVEEGEFIEAGQPVMILEAMKMENELKAPIAGIVTALFVKEGQNVEKNQKLTEIGSRG